MNDSVYAITSYRIPVKKLILNQFGAAMMGIMLTAACQGNRMLDLLTSLFAFFFFLFINYNAMWDIGAAARVRYDGGRGGKNGFFGLKASLLANIPNYVLAFLCFAFKLIGTFGKVAFCEKAAWFFNVVVRFWEAMYLGILVNIVPVTDAAGNAVVLSSTASVMYMLLYAAVTIPSLIIRTLGYRAGFNGFTVFPQKKDKK